MRIFIAGLSVETITFSTFPTSLHSFEVNGLHRGDGTIVSNHTSLSAPRQWRDLAEEAGHEVIESIMAFAQSAGTVVRPAYEDLRERILEDLKNAGPVDVVLYYMHGAMAADGYQDCEGDLATRTRDLVGNDVVIGMELDLHAHLTRQMIDNLTAIVTYKEYPHIDQVPRALELYKICLDAAAGLIRPI
ncbi:MAG: M81 family metallopeptidase, partial [Haliea sp.]